MPRWSSYNDPNEPRDYDDYEPEPDEDERDDQRTGIRALEDAEHERWIEAREQDRSDPGFYSEPAIQARLAAAVRAIAARRDQEEN